MSRKNNLRSSSYLRMEKIMIMMMMVRVMKIAKRGKIEVYLKKMKR